MFDVLRYVFNSTWLEEMRKNLSSKKPRNRSDKKTRDRLKLLGKWKPKKRK